MLSASRVSCPLSQFVHKISLDDRWNIPHIFKLSGDRQAFNSWSYFSSNSFSTILRVSDSTLGRRVSQAWNALYYGILHEMWTEYRPTSAPLVEMLTSYPSWIVANEKSQDRRGFTRLPWIDYIEITETGIDMVNRKGFDLSGGDPASAT